MEWQIKKRVVSQLPYFPRIVFCLLVYIWLLGISFLPLLQLSRNGTTPLFYQVGPILCRKRIFGSVLRFFLFSHLWTLSFFVFFSV